MHLLTGANILIAAGGISLVAVVAAAIKTLFGDVVDRLIKEFIGLFLVQIDMDDSAELMYFLKHHAKAFTLNRGYYSTAKEWVKPLGGMSTVFRRSAKMSHTLFVYKKAPILVSPSVPRSAGNQGWTPPKVWFLRGTVKWIELLLAAASFYDKRSIENAKNKTRRFSFTRHTGKRGSFDQVAINNMKGEKATSPSSPPASNDTKGSGPLASSYVGWTEEDIGFPPVEKLLLATRSLTSQEKIILRAVEFWYKNETWYRVRNIAWRLGCLLFGKPGGGKTSLIRAIAEHLDLPVHLFDLASMTNSDFIDAWVRSRQDGPRIVLLEDISDVFRKRKNQLEGGLTFDCLLQVLDGIEQEDGLLFFATTNEVEAIDDALGAPMKLPGGGYDTKTTRPGRIDIAVELVGFQYEGRFKMAMNILRDEADAHKLSTESTEDTPGQFKNRCIRFAVDKLWSEEHPGEVS